MTRTQIHLLGQLYFIKGQIIQEEGMYKKPINVTYNTQEKIKGVKVVISCENELTGFRKNFVFTTYCCTIEELDEIIDKAFPNMIVD